MMAGGCPVMVTVSMYTVEVTSTSVVMVTKTTASSFCAEAAAKGVTESRRVRRARVLGRCILW